MPAQRGNHACEHGNHVERFFQILPWISLRISAQGKDFLFITSTKNFIIIIIIIYISVKLPERSFSLYQLGTI